MEVLDDQEPSIAKKLGNVSMQHRASNGTRHGAALRLAYGVTMAYAPGIEGIWPLRGDAKCDATSLQLRMVSAIVNNRTSLASGHNFNFKTTQPASERGTVNHHTGFSKKRAPPKIPQNTVVLIIGTPKRVPLFSETPIWLLSYQALPCPLLAPSPRPQGHAQPSLRPSKYHTT